MKKYIFLFFIAFVHTTLPYNFSSDEIGKFNKNAILLSGNANLPLAQKISTYLQAPLGSTLVSTFNDGEVQIQIKDNIRNKHVFIIQPTCASKNQSINDNVMELYLLIRAAKRASAAQITIVIPYYGYARQDRKTTPRVPISAAEIAYMLEKAGINRMLTVDLHCGQIQGFFRNIPVDNLYASTVFVPYLKTKSLTNVVIVSPDAGGVDRATKLAEKLSQKNKPAHLAIISKKRAEAGVIDSMHLIGDVANADALIVDDICDTGGTLIKAAELLKKNGAKRVFTVITHPVFSRDALEKIGNSAIDEMIITDSIPLKKDAPKNITSISVAPLLGEAILRIQLGLSVSELF